MAITINPTSKLLILDSAAHSWQEIYSAWVDWVALSDNIKYLPAFKAIGGDDLGGGLYIPPYFFLLNGWRVRPMEANHVLILSGNGFVEGGGQPVVSTVGNYNVSVQYTVPVQAQAFSTSGSTGPTPAEIASETWAYLKSNSNVAGSFGEHVKSLGNSAGNTSYYELPIAVTRNVGSDQGGTLSNLQSHDDTYFATGEINGQGLTVTIDFNNAELFDPQSCKIIGYYNGSPAHDVEITVYNYVLGVYEHKGEMLSRTTPFDYSIPLQPDKISGTGDISIRLVHSITTYNSSHRLNIDHAYIELIDSSSTLISDINAIKNKTDQMSFELGKIAADVDLSGIPGAVRTELSSELSHVMTLQNGQGLDSTQATMLLEIYRLYGLDPARPLVVTQNARNVAGINQVIVASDTQTTITRV
jgi:hypothetical protein